MRRALLLLLIVSGFSLASCNAIQKKHDNPVMVVAPRRVDPVDSEEQTEEIADNDSATGPKEIEQTGASLKERLLKNPWDDWKDDTTIFNSQVAATVNGAPILNGDVLDHYASLLIGVREEMQKKAANSKLRRAGEPDPTPETYDKIRYQIIQSNIAVYIQKKLLVEHLRAGLKPEQLKMMNGHIDELFEKEIQRLKGELKVSNKTELELALNKKGTTLQNVKDNFTLDRLAQECIGVKSDKPEKVERPDLVSYYQSHDDLFLVNAKVKWQQIQVSITPEVNKKTARATLNEAISELNDGVPFEKVARKYSVGPNAKDGGSWDWMEAGNLADTKLDKKLFSMPLNQLSEIHEGPDSLCVVQVTGRETAGRKPFEEVQDEIRGILELEQNKNRSKRFLRNLYKNAEVETQYSIPPLIAPDD